MTTIVDNQVIHRESDAVTDNVPYLRCDECSRPLISFCLLTYNQAPFIREAIEAALAQTYSPLEIIISDDFSNDNTK
jgi:cellulose synthase/poly-beta-1,6-N-acetylglucosamine synthase-like glycosyltransferase